MCAERYSDDSRKSRFSCDFRSTEFVKSHFRFGQSFKDYDEDDEDDEMNRTNFSSMTSDESFNMSWLFEDEDSVLEAHYLNEHLDISESIIDLHAAFQYRKAQIREDKNFRPDTISKQIDPIKLNGMPELQYIVESMDFAQNREFSNCVFTGHNCRVIYPIPISMRRNIVLSILFSQIILKGENETYQSAIIMFDQCVLRLGEMKGETCFKLALAAIYIAFKMEEVDLLSIDDIIDLSGNRVTEAELCNMEKHILIVLDYNTIVSTSINYLRNISILEKCQNYEMIYEVAKIFLDVAMYHMSLSGYPLSLVAAAAHCTAKHLVNRDMLHENIWQDYLSALMGIEWSDLEPLCSLMVNIVTDLISSKSQTFNMIFHKYHVFQKNRHTNEMIRVIFRQLGDFGIYNESHVCTICKYVKSYVHSFNK